ncbi:MAG TPA: heavy-metal-associated domain-containing protein [Thermoanaerobaculia bacterium]|nr:heavy-metal-associated domain-containing protein [Thermoanaerobaculia bacterium]HXK66917.1 heavy-metal-associated domain-containing protein [Thermoanaerobaculia bacterium]
MVPNDEKLKFQVTGMGCDHCAAKIQKSLHVLKGVARVDVNPVSGIVQVEGGDLDRTVIVSTIEREGYCVQA